MEKDTKIESRLVWNAKKEVGGANPNLKHPTLTLTTLTLTLTLSLTLTLTLTLTTLTLNLILTLTGRRRGP
jgi:hypothetical protein